jgi:hypothetical protein
MATVAIGNQMYGCGGYVGHLGVGLRATPLCFVYTHGNPSGSQWSSIPSLPEKRSGGGLVYDHTHHSLLYSSGADEHDMPYPPRAVDHSNVWELLLDNRTAGWQIRASIPYTANHVGSASVTYDGIERHYITGGQDGPNEPST